jgi:hypothetical protein
LQIAKDRQKRIAKNISNLQISTFEQFVSLKLAVNDDDDLLETSLAQLLLPHYQKPSSIWHLKSATYHYTKKIVYKTKILFHSPTFGHKLNKEKGRDAKVEISNE